MSAPIADSVMAATYKLVQQAMSGQWQEVPKTLQERRDLLERICSTARPQDQEWLGALRQAMAESDAAVSRMAQAASSPAAAADSAAVEPPAAGTDAVTTIMTLLGKGG